VVNIQSTKMVNAAMRSGCLRDYGSSSSTAWMSFAEHRLAFTVIASDAKQSSSPWKKEWIASRSLSSGAHSRDPLARNDGTRPHA
jgi:hypothetical protein